ncbi:MBL fold metallo-hydrolase [Leptospira ognonensis]|uniref:MBL fold metallo-hydrolase n=1 Tax=Leptospira ognonensis TaxID=2484945 RepID=A0A4R9JY14_9LEPT|nr:MBL fold metallo-hydrolase [Leptospira ognonensis]TGL57075.1 MBL fold metallo-hydrolase [Leptospira ognonensis]
MKVQHFFDSDTFTLTYLVYDEDSEDGILIDPVLDFDPNSGNVSTKNLQRVINYIQSKKIKLRAILETHVHADHLSGSQFLKKHFPEAVIGVGERIKLVQETFKKHFNLLSLKTDGSQFDHLFTDFEKVKFGSIFLEAIPTPGHTPACMSYLIGDLLFTGDALFMPDYGTGRCDFPNGSAKDLYQSISKNLYTLPEQTRAFVGHDYLPNGRELKFETTIGNCKSNNIQLSEHTTESDYIAFRENRDQGLAVPRLLLPSIQVNINAGILPEPESNGTSYLKWPLHFILENP